MPVSNNSTALSTCLLHACVTTYILWAAGKRIGAESHTPTNAQCQTWCTSVFPRLDRLLSPRKKRDLIKYCNNTELNIYDYSSCHNEFLMFHLQAIHGQFIKALPFSFGSLRFASSFKVMRKTLTLSFSPGELWVVSIQLGLQAGVTVRVLVSQSRVYIDHYGKKEVTFVPPTSTCTCYLRFKVSFPLCLSLTVCLCDYLIQFNWTYLIVSNWPDKSASPLTLYVTLN